MFRSVCGIGGGLAPLEFGAAAVLDALRACEPDLNEPEFAAQPITSHHKPRISEILAGISTLNLPLKLYAGKATLKHAQPTDKSLEVWKLANSEGYQIQFEIVEGSGKPHDDYGKIYALWVKVDVEKQGAVWKLKAFIEQVASLLLQHCGYSCLLGHAIAAANSEIKNLLKPDPEYDWRWLPVFCGWSVDLQPIVHQGLLALYVKIGFILHPKHGDKSLVVYPSRAYTQQFISEHGQAKWNEATQLSFARRHEWRAIQKQRAAQVSQPEEKIREALERPLKRLKEQRRAFERQIEHAWKQINEQRYVNRLLGF